MSVIDMSAHDTARYRDRTFSHFIDGRLVGGSARLGVTDPATAKVFAFAPDADLALLDEAVSAARRAFCPWRALGYDGRRALIRAFGVRLAEERDTIAHLLTAEQGKPLAAARAEIDQAVRQLEAACSLLVEDELLEERPGNRVLLRYMPLGVVGVIKPWNAPISLAVNSIAQALFAGNSVVLKPSPYTPLSSLLIGELAGPLLPAGVLNIVAGKDDVGVRLVEHPDVPKISFTGSIPTGKKIMAAASAHLKRLSLELGGNDAAIVCADVDVAEIAPQLFASAFAGAGQICMAIKRLYIHEAILPDMSAALAALASAWRVGDGFAEGVQMGPVQNRMQFDKVWQLIDMSRGQAGARILAGGERFVAAGYFIPPTLIAGLADDAPLVREEQFGPALPILSWREDEDVIARANAGAFGLAGSVWSKDIARATAIAERLETGMVWINKHLGANVRAPFGGAKQSGLGRSRSLLGLKSYMEPQVIDTFWT